MEEVLVALVVCGFLFIGLPWIIFHYITRWKTAATLTPEDENLLDELHELARRLDDRMSTIERIVQADNPNWRQLAADPVETALEEQQLRRLRRAELDELERLEPSAGRANRPNRRH